MVIMLPLFATMLICTKQLLASSAPTSPDHRPADQEPPFEFESASSEEGEEIPGDWLEQYSHDDWQPHGISLDPAEWIRTGPPFYNQQNARIVQDPTGFNHLIDDSFLQDVPLTLTGNQLVAYHQAFIVACRPYLQHLLHLRLTSFDRVKTILHFLKQTMRFEGYVDFAEYADANDDQEDEEERILAECHASIQALGSQYLYFKRLIAAASQLKQKFDAGQHLVGTSNTSLRKASKKRVALFKNDLEEMHNWTRPGSICQVDVYLSQHGYRHLQAMMQREEERARHIASRW